LQESAINSVSVTKPRARLPFDSSAIVVVRQGEDDATTGTEDVNTVSRMNEAISRQWNVIDRRCNRASVSDCESELPGRIVSVEVDAVEWSTHRSRGIPLDRAGSDHCRDDNCAEPDRCRAQVYSVSKADADCRQGYIDNFCR